MRYGHLCLYGIPKFAGQVLPDRTESRLVFLTFYLTSMGYQLIFSYDKIPGHKFGEHLRSKILAKTKIYILSRAELHFAMRYPVFVLVLSIWNKLKAIDFIKICTY